MLFFHVACLRVFSISTSNETSPMSTSLNSFSSLSTSSLLLNQSDLDTIANTTPPPPPPVSLTKTDLINRLSSTLSKTNFTVSSNQSSKDSATKFTAYRNTFRNELNRISKSKNNDNEPIMRRRVSNIISTFETLPQPLNQRPKTMSTPGFNSQQSRSFKLLQETLENGSYFLICLSF